MSFDGLVTRAVTYELKNKVIGGKIQKISQPSKNDIVLSIYSLGKSYKLMISANNNEGRVSFSNEKFENPQNPPNFCMVLRKYLNQSKIIDIEQYKLDRVIIFHISSIDEMGFDVSNKLIVEIMGKYSNIILTDDNFKIIDSIKRVNNKMSSVREILPGKNYNFIKSDKFNILENFDKDIYYIDKKTPDNANPKELLYSTYLGFSPTIANELCYRAGIDTRVNWGLVSEDEKKALNKNIIKLRSKLLENDYTPTLYKENNKFKEFYSFRLRHLQYEYKKYDFISEAIEEFYKVNKSNDRLRQIKNDLERKINSHIKSTKKKITILDKNLSKENSMELYRKSGDLLAANINKISKGMNSIRVNNFYDENKEIKIIIDPLKNPWENVDNYYKRYKKLKNSISYAKKDYPNQIEYLNYLLQLLDFVERSDSINDLDDIKSELISNKIIKDSSRNKKSNKEKSKPKHYITINNSHIYVGKNSRQNDYITLKLAGKHDYFFHVRNAPGSHVILKTDNFNENDLISASYLAASNSSLSNSLKVDVDYTEKKNVNKAKGSKLGMVYYENFNTITVDLSDKPKDLYKRIQ
ncbi:fibronectin/fibrinogen-binding protein [Anaerococcus sp. AGMB00486]|uniref:Rqc2 homolog RqcH n=2 Tax=Anaerococcus TaxID=165779 RepID=A0ABX2N7B5_9FIRM|nr:MULTISPECIES: NFACT RNA binding domain-containing protein [Anaerococcus]MSS76936.1 fibronectin/fibrinogen-binding protein [Anaerococcus porci]NVF10579.1 fibronectin/fibrinogen-binding protein [Anaerococcus faecalis]